MCADCMCDIEDCKVSQSPFECPNCILDSAVVGKFSLKLRGDTQNSNITRTLHKYIITRF